MAWQALKISRRAMSALFAVGWAVKRKLRVRHQPASLAPKRFRIAAGPGVAPDGRCQPDLDRIR